MKKKQQLGMNPSTASGRLVKDILWKFIVDTKSNMCFHCSLPMTRETFSIEHKVPWLDSEKPIELFFDLENVSFSHMSCNRGAARRKPVIHTCGVVQKYWTGCRCGECISAWAEHQKNNYCADKRHIRYVEKGT